ncbi:Zn-ribbon domain-containing OB-fold protein [Zoogloea sp. LCSB751]|uniref:Zn-ribbon domain-containing OB-fold protein n=1 Tax=Zoogloea sp. LCSB751 TaxID=1965277 RepID=UPI0009A54A2F|nr:OB-fold domain-containing protein [Zoogloea sp. LCSB751]
MARKLPALNPDNIAFWQGGETGSLNIHHCSGCRRYFHPPAPICPHCLSQNVAPRPVSGRGKVISYTINHQRWQATLEVPYVVAIVELKEQTGLRLVSNIVGMPADEVRIDLPVKVTFSQIEDVWLPFFEKEA